MYIIYIYEINIVKHYKWLIIVNKFILEDDADLYYNVKTILCAILATCLWEDLAIWDELLGILVTDLDVIDWLGIFENTVTFLEVTKFGSWRLIDLSLLKFQFWEWVLIIRW